MTDADRPWALIRADAGRGIGAGHVMRCLTVAGRLREGGVEAVFLCREHEGHLAASIEAAGHRVRLAPLVPDGEAGGGYAGWRGAPIAQEIAFADEVLAERGRPPLLIVDHYGLDAVFEEALRPRCAGIAVFDDLHVVRHACDVVIDQNIGHDPGMFGDLAPGALLLVGADYAPLRAQFAQARDAALARRWTSGPARHLLVSVGGFDSLDITSKVLAALELMGEGARTWVERTDIVLAGNAPHLERVRARAAQMPSVRLNVDVDDMPRLLAAADLAIGAAGVSAIERCVMGLPTLTVVVADNQVSAARRLEELGAAETLGHGDALTPQEITDALLRFGSDEARRRAMTERAASLCDGLGLTRIAGPLMRLAQA